MLEKRRSGRVSTKTSIEDEIAPRKRCVADLAEEGDSNHDTEVAISTRPATICPEMTGFRP